LTTSYIARPLKEGDSAALAAARTFARRSLFERIWLHAALEIPALLARVELFEVLHAERVVGLAAVIEGLFPFRLTAVDGALPGVAEALLRGAPRPFVCPVPARLAAQVARAGGREIRSELQMVRLDSGIPLSSQDERVEALSDADELTRFCGTGFARLELELGPFFGIRDAFGELAAVAGARFATERVALLAHLETREDCRRQGYARALATAAVRALEGPERRVVVQLNEGEQAARALFASLGFRGTQEFRVFAF
jgi:ribosomal protein S18 acetylase RimI-like enzyme